VAKRKKNTMMSGFAKMRWEKTTKEQRLKVGQDLARARKKARAKREKTEK
jgi:hypothetical protein